MCALPDGATVYAEADLIPLSALQHYIFCPRQCALIHVERLWTENRLTAEGRLMHERPDTPGREVRGSKKRVFGLALRSLRLGLSGKADVVEFNRNKAGAWIPYPVEHKRGKPKKDFSDKVQLCAQAMCLEEMLGVEIAEGALFYGKQKRRLAVPLDEQLRRLTQDTALAAHELLASGTTPPPAYSKRCEQCSFIATCLPRKVEKGGGVSRYLQKIMGEA